MDNSGIKLGMNIAQVRHLLPGWTDHPIRLAGNSYNPVHVWDFTPPEGSTCRSIRITFDNSGVVLWGEPAERNMNAPKIVNNLHALRLLIAASGRASGGL